MPVIFNAANEAAVRKFLKDEIGFLQIYELIEEAMDSVAYTKDPDVEGIFETERETLEFIDAR